MGLEEIFPQLQQIIAVTCMSDTANVREELRLDGVSREAVCCSVPAGGEVPYLVKSSADDLDRVSSDSSQL